MFLISVHPCKVFIYHGSEIFYFLDPSNWLLVYFYLNRFRDIAGLSFVTNYHVLCFIGVLSVFLEGTKLLLLKDQMIFTILCLRDKNLVNHIKLTANDSLSPLDNTLFSEGLFVFQFIGLSESCLLF